MADVAPPVTCPHAAACGGCPLIALPYAEQLARKERRVRAALGRFALLARVPVAPIAPADPVAGYRARAKLVVGPAGVGLYGPSGHDLVDLPGCRVQSPELAAVAARVRALVAAGEAPVHAEGRAAGLRGLDLRGSAEGAGVLVTLIVDDEPGARAAAEALGRRLVAEEPAVAGVFVAPHAGRSPQLLAPRAYHVAGAATVADRIGATRYLAGPGAFVQAHRGQAARVHAIAAAHVGAAGGARVLDLYAGGGGIGLALARAGARVTLVEAFEPAARDARRSAEANGLDVEVLASPAEQAVADLIARRARFDAVVVNPPRRGCARPVREALAAIGAARVVYVSCDPETLARDLSHLRTLGYAAARVEPVDMIPLTDEVESVALLGRAPPPAPPVLHLDDELMVVDKWPDEPLRPRPGAPACTLERVRRRPGWERAEPLDTLGDGASGVASFVRTPQALPAWHKAGEGRSTFAALVRGQSRDGGTARAPGGAQPLRYRRVGAAGGQSLVHVTAEGDARGQLRPALAAIGHPVVGDARHGHEPTNRHAAERHALGRMFLHALRLERIDPRTGASLAFEAELAPDLALVLDRMGGLGR